MDTKLKNNNKRGNLLTVIVLLISSVGMLLFYPAFSSYITDQDQKEMRKEEQMLDMLDPILDGNYLLYNEISNETESSRGDRRVWKQSFRIDEKVHEIWNF